MDGEWKTHRVGDIAAAMGDAPFGSLIKNHDYTDSGALVVQGKNIQGRTCDWSDRRFVSHEKYQSLQRSHCMIGDLLFPKVGTIGKVGILTECPGVAEYLLSTNTMRFRADPKVAIADYVYYFFTWSETVNLIHALNSNSVQPVFNFTSLKNFEIPLPPLPIQRRIAAILGSLDDKIELNRQMNETLEAIAKALFQSWFVDFDPVHAKVQGKKPEGMNEATAALFPDSFVESELGLIPKGWTIASLLEQNNLLSGGTPKTDIPTYWNGNIPWASAKDVSQCNDTFLISTERTITPKGVEESSTKIIPQFATVIVARGATTGRLTLLAHPMAMNQTCYGLHSKFNLPFATYCHISHFIKILVKRGHGSVFDTITTGTFESTGVINYPVKILREFNNRSESLFQRIRYNLYQSQELSSLRDTLLPKLLSGELSTNRANEQFGEARHA